MLNKGLQIEAINLLYVNSLITEEEYDVIEEKIEELERHNNFVLTDNLEKDEVR